MRKKLKSIGIVCFCAMLACGCQKLDSNQEFYQLENNIDLNEDEVLDEENLDMKIETPYGELFYEEQWKDYFEFEIVNEENCRIDFWANIETYNFKLFSIIYGTENEGTLLGKINFNQGEEISVCLLLEEIKIPKEFPREKIDCVYAMQEEVNNICEQLYRQRNFKKNNE